MRCSEKPLRSQFRLRREASISLRSFQKVFHSRNRWASSIHIRRGWSSAGCGTFGEERTRALLDTNNRAPSLSAYVLDAKNRDAAMKSLEAVGCVVKPGLLLRDAWTLHGGNPAASDAVKHSWIAIQDEASQAVARTPFRRTRKQRPRSLRCPGREDITAFARAQARKVTWSPLTFTRTECAP